MNFQGLQAKYRRLYNESITWKLLRADNAPLILAFFKSLFAEDNEVLYSRARIALETELIRCRELGIWETETNAAAYINQWINSGWLREMDDMLSKTDHSEMALRFCQGLDERTSGTTASHLRIVQEAVRDFAVAISANADDRISLLEHKKAEIQLEIDNLQAGIISELTDAEQRERIKEIYQLASVLTGDFRRVEDETRQLDKALRIKIIEDESSRGDVLISLMDNETALAKSEAGSAFESFFQLLCDQNRSMEFREQLRSILSHVAAQQLTATQQRYLGQLMRVLSSESERVFKIRRRTEEDLRTYIESGAAMENRAVNKLLSKLKRVAVHLRETNCELKTLTPLSIPVSAISIVSPEAWRLKAPDEKLDTRDITESINSREPNTDVLDSLDTVQLQEIAMSTLVTLQKHGPMTIASLTKINNLQSGLEELVAYLRVAKAINATIVDNKELVTVTDKHGAQINVSIPVFLLSAELFPTNIDQLEL